MKIQLSERQKTALDLLDDPQVTEIYYGGAAGSGKTMLICIWMLLQCRNYAGIRIGLGRKELTRLKQTTLTTLLREAHRLLEVGKGYNYQDHKGLLTYKNDSSIQLIDLARQPSDPDFDTLGSLNLTHVVIDEGGELVKKAKDAIGARRNRFMNKEHNIIGKLIVTGNPSQNFTRDEYYEPYAELGAGDYRKWQFGEVVVDGVKKSAYRAFVKALPTDNPFLPANYIEILKNLPNQERKRLYEGNWNYLDDDDMLFTSILIDRSLIGDKSQEGDITRFIGVDVADKGSDQTIATLIEDGIITEQQALSVDASGEKAISELTALELIKYAQQRGFTAAQAKQIAVEGNGVGVGVRDFMRSKGWFIQEYTATASSRSQGYYDMSTAMDKSKLKIWSQLPTLDKLRRQLMVLTYEFNEKLEPVVLAKKKVKELLGHSPDEADSAYIAYWVAQGQSDPKANSNRIIF